MLGGNNKQINIVGVGNNKKISTSLGLLVSRMAHEYYKHSYIDIKVYEVEEEKNMTKILNSRGKFNVFIESEEKDTESCIIVKSVTNGIDIKVSLKERIGIQEMYGVARTVTESIMRAILE